MATQQYDIVRGTFTVREKNKKVQKGPGETISLDEKEAERYLSVGDLVPAGSQSKRGSAKSADLKSAERKITQLQGELAAVNTELGERNGECDSLAAVIQKIRETHPDAVEAATAAIAEAEAAARAEAEKQG